MSPISYPPARRDTSVTDNYHGTVIPDPYRWLEDPESEETKQFVSAQSALTNTLLAECSHIDPLRREITKVSNFPHSGTPYRRGNNYFYYHNTGLQDHRVFYVKTDLDGEGEVLFDPNGLSEDGSTSLKWEVVSNEGKYMACGLSSSGSDWITVKVMRIQDKKMEPDTLSWIKFMKVCWTVDEKGFFYSRYPEPKKAASKEDLGTETEMNLNNAVYYHFLGTDQSEDILCWEDPEHPRYVFGNEVTDDGKYALLFTLQGGAPTNKLYYCDLSSLPHGLEGFRGSKEMLPFIKLVDKFEASYEYVSNDDTEFTLLTDKEAPRFKLVRVNLKEPELWNDIVKEDEKDVLESAHAVNGNQLLIRYLSDVKHILQIRDLNSGVLLHHLPTEVGTVSKINGRRQDSEVFVCLASFVIPLIIYKCNLAADVPEVKVFQETSVPGYNRADYQVKQVFYPSKDGTKIPMFIASKKDIDLCGSHPALLDGYGGFGRTLTPSFDLCNLVRMKNLGFIYCMPNIRGGGEYGEEWHQAGSRANKQNCIDDFIAAAEFLISSGYTNPKKLCIQGSSNGGLVVAACINQRPELFGCALVDVGVMDMLRYHKFTIGHAWIPEFGCSDNEEEFHWLIKYSPLHNVQRPWERNVGQPCQYPPTMLWTADHDDRVVPLHSLKMLATMQYVLCTNIENSPQTNPIIANIVCKAGHGKVPLKRNIDEAAIRYGFASKMLDVSWIE